MTKSAHIDTQLRVTSVRSRGPMGGVIFAGKDNAGQTYVVKADFVLAPDPSLFETAQVWKVTGTCEPVVYVHNGVVKTETQITPETLALQRPSGKNIVFWIAQSSDCKGIGEVRARRLFERFGNDLIRIIETGDVESLLEVIDAAAAESLVAAFAKYGVAQTLVWLEQMSLPKDVARSVARFLGKGGSSKVKANPYLLVSFCADWKQVDELARLRFGICQNDSRRLIAACEDVLYRSMGNGDTALPRGRTETRLKSLLGSADLARQAIAEAIADSKVIEDGDLLQAAGLAYIENYVGRSLMAMLAAEADGQAELLQAEIPATSEVLQQLALYESINGIVLTLEQQQAVVTSATSRVSLILGGAGTGKTTVLKALIHVLEGVTTGVEVYQFALAGRAAQRMTQSTGRPAKTIAAFLNGLQVAPGASVLIDEMSMVDVILMYRVFKVLPHGVRLVLIGDPAQLPPIGPGVVLHALEGLEAIPQTTLTTVKRQDLASGIPQVALAIRRHETPTWAQYAGRGNGVCMVPCEESQLNETVGEVYCEIGGTGTDYTVQILGTTKSGAGGVTGLNAMIHGVFSRKQLPIQSLHPDFGLIWERTEENLGLFTGDLVMFGANDYELGLRNGSLGRILHPVVPSTSSATICIAEFEGSRYELTTAHLRHIAHAYAITAHKSQGSQFNRVIVPIKHSKLLDNALLYTAITRGVQQVVLIGDIAAAERAVRNVSNACRRVTRLQRVLAA